MGKVRIQKLNTYDVVSNPGFAEAKFISKLELDKIREKLRKEKLRKERKEKLQKIEKRNGWKSIIKIWS